MLEQTYNKNSCATTDSQQRARRAPDAGRSPRIRCFPTGGKLKLQFDCALDQVSTSACFHWIINLYSRDALEYEALEHEFAIDHQTYLQFTYSGVRITRSEETMPNV